MALMVFFWGVLYKTSLYHPAKDRQAAVPPAKLLSEAERTSAARADVAPWLPSVSGDGIVAAAVLIFLLSDVESARSRFAVLRAKTPAKPPSLVPISGSYFFRPPPFSRA
jgi:hypothetical protein